MVRPRQHLMVDEKNFKFTESPESVRICSKLILHNRSSIRPSSPSKLPFPDDAHTLCAVTINWAPKSRYKHFDPCETANWPWTSILKLYVPAMKPHLKLYMAPSEHRGGCLWWHQLGIPRTLLTAHRSTPSSAFGLFARCDPKQP